MKLNWEMLPQQRYGMMEIGRGGGGEWDFEIAVIEEKKNKRYCLVYDKSNASKLVTGGWRIFMANTVVFTND
jgi:hypothetical protein